MNILKWYTAIAMIASVGQTLFTLLYLTFPWYKTFLGRALFLKALTLTLLLDVALASTLWDWKHEAVWVVSLYGLTAFGIWAQMIAFAIQRFTPANPNSTQPQRDYRHGIKPSGETDGQVQSPDSRARVTD